MSTAVVRPREDIIEDALRIWFTIKDTSTVDPAYRTVMAAVVDFVTAVERERCALAVETHSGFGDPATIDACIEIIRAPIEARKNMEQ